jgi:hypothetical protein
VLGGLLEAPEVQLRTMPGGGAAKVLRRRTAAPEGPQLPSQASAKGLEGPGRRLRTRVAAPQEVNELLPRRRTSLPRRGIPHPTNRAERITLAVELEHERRQVRDTQLPRAGPEADRGIREPTKTLKGLDSRGTGCLPESHEEVAGRTAHQLAPRVPGHGEEGLVDVEDRAICQPDDDDGVRTTSQDSDSKMLHPPVPQILGGPYRTVPEAIRSRHSRASRSANCRKPPGTAPPHPGEGPASPPTAVQPHVLWSSPVPPLMASSMLQYR